MTTYCQRVFIFLLNALKYVCVYKDPYPLLWGVGGVTYPFKFKDLN